jgi:hypothetical protein
MMTRCFFPPVALLLAATSASLAAEPIRLHPGNPHYFQFRGRPAILVTGGEHYGAVLNLDFDYVKYLDELKSKGLNLTRTFTGAYREVPKDFNIARNTLAPAPGRFICPWPEVTQDKFDLKRWNEAYFRRLKDFVAQAGRRGVVVELVLFCPYYQDSMWAASPLNATNNVNGIGKLKRTEALTLNNGELFAVQEAMVRRIVAELKDFDNLYYEICNEPYFGGVTIEWQHRIADIITSAETSFSARHLIAQNIANGSKKIEDPHPAVSIFNFHYSRPPDSVAMNYHLNKVIGYDETGFDGTGDAAYRIQAWDFIIAGGAVYSHLDFSFTAGHEDGSFQYPPAQPGGGTATLRNQFRILKQFMERFDFIRMAPHNDVLRGEMPEGASTRVLAEPEKAYAIYVHHGRVVKDAKPRYQVDASRRSASLRLALPAGPYQAEWIDTKSGAPAKRERFSSSGAEHTLVSPDYSEDIALRIRRR